MMIRSIHVCAAVVVAVTLLATGCGGGGGGSTPRPEPEVTIPAASEAMAGTGGGPARTLSTPALSVASGGTVSVPVSVNDAGGVAGATLTLAFDPAVFSCTDATSPLEDATVVANPNSSPGHAVIALACTSPAAAGRQVIANFVLEVSGAAGQYPVALAGTVFDTHGMELAATGGAGPAAIAAGPTNLVGDLTGAGRLTVGSALRVMRVARGLDAAPPAADLWRWDVNGNGGVDMDDAVQIIRCAAGLTRAPI